MLYIKSNRTLQERLIMKINQSIYTELLLAIKNRKTDSFEVSVSGSLNHFISSEGQARGLYIGTIKHDGADFKIYMV